MVEYVPTELLTRANQNILNEGDRFPERENTVNVSDFLHNVRAEAVVAETNDVNDRRARALRAIAEEAEGLQPKGPSFFAER